MNILLTLLKVMQKVTHQKGHTQGLVCLGDMSFYLG